MREDTSNERDQRYPGGQGADPRALAEQAQALRLTDIPDDSPGLGAAVRAGLPSAAGSPAPSDELAAILLAEMREQGGKEAATVLGHAGRLPVASAAMVNGAAAHALDFDDVNLAMPGHPSVAILPALLALAEERGSSAGRMC